MQLLHESGFILKQGKTAGKAGVSALLRTGVMGLDAV
jgi:hypothetical protein